MGIVWNKSSKDNRRKNKQKKEVKEIVDMNKLSEFNSNFMNVCRILAAWFVLIGHACVFFNVTILKNEDYFPHIQNIGVIILFLLSGFFTIYSINDKIHKNTNYSFRHFFIDRFIRIGMVYFPALLFTLLIDKIHIFLYPDSYLHFDAFNVKTFIANIFMLQDYKRIVSEDSFFTSFGSNRPLWTLAIEWWIYMAIGFLVFVVIKSYKANKLSIYQILIFLVLAWIPINNLMGGRGNGLSFTWLLGVGIYYLYTNLHTKRYVVGMVGLLAFLFAIIFACLEKEAYATFFVIMIAIFIFSILFLGKDRDKVYFTKIIKFFSGYTYSLYATHYAICEFMQIEQLNMNSHMRFYISIILCNAIAIIYAQIFERKSKLTIAIKDNFLLLVGKIENRYKNILNQL